ncbi:restriction endonuclease subunit S [uncultured Methanobrevibacter sp.]|uniref:restriction endonuclease subunit S n=1 Tax=uncultured Methanobrevibacter sp. TaxID=253161 RepID=UPI0025F51FDE|nr:restriction endonuclease subunit S [uncultured Methanobrevibacter sp.]
MSYKAYNSYKDSKIDWIKEIPDSWSISRVKNISLIKSGESPNFDDNGQYDVIGANGKIGQTNRFNISTYHIIIGRVGASGSVNISPEFAFISDNAFILTLNKNIDLKYSFYLFKALDMDRLINKNAQPLLTATQIKNLFIPYTTLNEQKQIANYLDKKTAKIDTTIAKNKELIQLLEEKRVALINQVVTKGLNHDVPMKDSGVEWIGEIPEHWDVVPLNRYVNVTKLAGFEFTEHIEYIPDGEIIALRALNIKNNKLNLNNIMKISKEVSNKLPRSKLFKGDLIFTYVGAKTGAVALIDKNNTYHLAPNIAKITNISKDKLNTQFLLYNIASHHEQEEIWFKIAKSGQEAISMEKIRTLTLLIPPIEEQRIIIDHLNEKISKIDEAVLKITKNIHFLEEYKTSLIHHVVTGKIDVRGEEI